MVHKPFRLPEIIEGMKKLSLEPKRMQLVQPYTDKEPNMVLIEAVKGAGPFCKILPTLVVYDEERRLYTGTSQILRYVIIGRDWRRDGICQEYYIWLQHQ